MHARGPIRCGAVLRVGRAASVQFADNRALVFRVIRCHDWSTYDGWMWLDGYVLDGTGLASDRRSIFVRIDGLEPVRVVAARTRTTRREPRPPATGGNGRAGSLSAS